ncbi:MAG: class II aldolase/adducin family protein [Candidatus Eisenbacteria bacterium]|nr:class II aldolase/adducin family protein [Candidatus Eisenbacteria bacterium]
MADETAFRNLIVETGRRLWLRGYVASNDGNISVRLDDGSILVTPTGVSKGFLRSEDLVVVSRSGERIRGPRVPTSELGVHLAAYAASPRIMAVVHAHPPAATAFAAAGVELDHDILPEVVVTLGRVPTAPYGTPSTSELEAAVAPFLAEHAAVLLENHGALTVGPDLETAYFRMETVEHAADVAIRARTLGGPRRLPGAAVEKLSELRSEGD